MTEGGIMFLLIFSLYKGADADMNSLKRQILCVYSFNSFLYWDGTQTSFFCFLLYKLQQSISFLFCYSFMDEGIGVTQRKFQNVDSLSVSARVSVVS